jgi:hypothetical protein
MITYDNKMQVKFDINHNALIMYKRFFFKDIGFVIYDNREKNIL